ncbi:MAG: UDP-N-acetylglucosamine 1-carboxyvinyltransferase [Alphaproteobacteria bacterium]|jgi:UDP-N-acetylglucosamine 1-carboxyvinyltransferase|nr:UDP-N-acetylglucosamine 1-carboxyvinyltransferase [Alphaproteobacteria bacterium]MBT5389301.1 UDP-N-acetylglucosamine 1-carboxyvinyltransferase [Alphaproteobacteria bacterium]MBT5540806.1 UDP-N-acetylglucosamine 1-carboxyvinyltransferase [Alphaproteobacteria bacterium]MBT5654238.1 UDP-N-acetylglucosamine 1-carboxyvinyltransferase [Alphaproteobacteria bacterium]
MDKIRIRGGVPLKGQVTIGGAKNAALPLMTACLLTDKPLVLSNLPHVADIATLANLLAQLGVQVTLEGDETKDGHMGRVFSLQTKEISNTTAPYDLVRKMRASVLVLGPLLAREGRATVSLPGGCAIGTRPVDLHLQGLEAMGAKIELDQGYVHATAPKGLHGNSYTFPVVSVGATENLLLAASIAKGETQLVNAAREPEITDLANCLVKMGAKIEGIGTDTLTIQGVDSLSGAQHSVLPDRIETGTYAIAAAITGGSIDILNTDSSLVPTFLSKLEETGAKITHLPNGFNVAGEKGKLQGVNITTEPFPGYATDLQAQMMAMMTIANGASLITETIFENRFMHVPELMRMGADISLKGSSAMVKGVPELKGAELMATDLRASVSLVLAALAAQGESTINRVYHIDRGYEYVESKLRSCGAQIERIRE